MVSKLKENSLERALAFVGGLSADAIKVTGGSADSQRRVARSIAAKKKRGSDSQAEYWHLWVGKKTGEA